MDRSSSGAKGWMDIPFPTNCFESGVVTLEFYDAERGESEDALIDTLTFRYSYRDPSEEESPTTGQDGQGPLYGDGNTEPTGESNPGSGRKGR